MQIEKAKICKEIQKQGKGENARLRRCAVECQHSHLCKPQEMKMGVGFLTGEMGHFYFQIQKGSIAIAGCYPSINRTSQSIFCCPISEPHDLSQCLLSFFYSLQMLSITIPFSEFLRSHFPLTEKSLDSVLCLFTFYPFFKLT